MSVAQNLTENSASLGKNDRGITYSVDEDWDLLEDARHQAVEWLHPVTSEEEVSVNVKVAAVVLADLGTESLHDLVLVEVLADPLELVVAKTAALAVLGDIVDVSASLLVRTDHGIVAVDGCRDARPDTLAVVAVLDQAQATRKGVVHGLALALVKDSGGSTLTTSHGAVVFVLGQAIGETVADQDRLEVDVALLVGENLGSENGNVVSSVRFASNVEVLVSILRELLEEESHQGVDVLASCYSVANRAATVGVTDVDGLVKEDDGGVGVPRKGVEFSVDLLVDKGWAKLHEKTSQRRAARATVQPEDHGIVLGVVTGLEEPYKGINVTVYNYEVV